MAIDRQQEKMKSQSSLKALQILVCLAEKNDSTSTISEISNVTGLSPSTVHRILQELSECGFVQNNKVDHHYSLGFSSWSLAMKIKNQNFVIKIAYEEMLRLNDLSSETIHLMELEGDRGVYLEKIPTKYSIGLLSQVGGHFPLYCTAGGKSILSSQSDEWIEEYLSHVKFQKYTQNTIVDPNALREEIKNVRQQGYSIDDHEHHNDIVCVAVPIFQNSFNNHFAIGISAPDYRFSVDKAKTFVDELKESASRIIQMLR